MKDYGICCISLSSCCKWRLWCPFLKTTPSPQKFLDPIQMHLFIDGSFVKYNGKRQKLLWGPTLFLILCCKLNFSHLSRVLVGEASVVLQQCPREAKQEEIHSSIKIVIWLLYFFLLVTLCINLVHLLRRILLSLL